MTISPFMVYLIFLADKVVCFAVIGAFLSFGVGGISLLTAIGAMDEHKRAVSGVVKRLIVAFVAFALTAILVPDTKTMVAMTVIPPVVNNEQVQQLPAEVLTWIRDQLKTKEM